MVIGRMQWETVLARDEEPRRAGCSSRTTSSKHKKSLFTLQKIEHRPAWMKKRLLTVSNAKRKPTESGSREASWEEYRNISKARKDGGRKVKAQLGLKLEVM